MKLFLLSLLVGLAGISLALSQESGEATPNAAPPESPVSDGNSDKPAVADRESGLKLNFRNVPLETVLDYLSQAAGFIIVMDAEVSGSVTAWSHQPVTKDEAVELLNTVLFAKGFSVIRNGRTLMIVNRDEARTRNIPVRSGSDPEQIPSTDVMVTQIIPVRTVDVGQLSETLQPLLGEHATLSANEGSNALILTDSQKNIRRIAEIVQALDQSVNSIATIRVFPLKYADATETVTIIKEVFDGQSGSGSGGSRSSSSSSSGRPDFRAMMMERFGGGGDRGGRGGDRGRGDRDRDRGRGRGESAALEAGSRVVAVADERSNSVIIGAPADTIDTIEELIGEIDQNVTDLTEIRVFKLKNADPTELAEIFNQLFEDEESSSSGGSERRGPGFFFGRSRSEGNQEGSGLKSDQKVVVVPDARTTSLIVSASRQMMPQIEQMIEQLDASNAKKQRVFVYTLDHADVNKVSDMLKGMFEGENSRNTSGTGTQQDNALSTRSGGFGNAGASAGGTGGAARGTGGGGGFGR